MIPRRLRTTLRNAAAGVTWSVRCDGAQDPIEITVDDDAGIMTAQLMAWVRAHAAAFVPVPPT